MVKNENNELLPTQTVIGWQMYIDYQKHNDANPQGLLSTTLHGLDVGKDSGPCLLFLFGWLL